MKIRSMLGIISAACGMTCSAPALAAFYRCVGPGGATITSNTAILDCKGELSVQQQPGAPWTLIESRTPEQIALFQECERKRAAAIRIIEAKDRVERALVAKYPDQTAHDKARSSALEGIRQGQQRSEKRLGELAAQRKPLDDEAAFYSGKPLPMKLKRDLDANDAAVEAQKAIRQMLRQEASDTTAKFDVELISLQMLWSGKKVAAAPPPACLASR